VRLEGLGKLKKILNDLMGSLIRDLPTFSTVPQIGTIKYAKLERTFKRIEFAED
jgi:hypothetical protein